MSDPIVTIYLEDGGFTIYDRRKSETVTKPLNATALTLELGLILLAYCVSCGTMLRRSEGDGPCSDCHETQCADKTKEETPVSA